MPSVSCWTLTDAAGDTFFHSKIRTPGLTSPGVTGGHRTQATSAQHHCSALHPGPRARAEDSPMRTFSVFAPLPPPGSPSPHWLSQPGCPFCSPGPHWAPGALQTHLPAASLGKEAGSRDCSLILCPFSPAQSISGRWYFLNLFIQDQYPLLSPLSFPSHSPQGPHCFNLLFILFLLSKITYSSLPCALVPVSLVGTLLDQAVHSLFRFSKSFCPHPSRPGCSSLLASDLRADSSKGSSSDSVPWAEGHQKQTTSLLS